MESLGEGCHVHALQTSIYNLSRQKDNHHKKVAYWSMSSIRSFPLLNNGMNVFALYSKYIFKVDPQAFSG